MFAINYNAKVNSTINYSPHIFQENFGFLCVFMNFLRNCIFSNGSYLKIPEIYTESKVVTEALRIKSFY